ncbi:MAG: HepT-like ribonuclease domain-containing protein [candidate division NC10 bacterium]
MNSESSNIFDRLQEKAGEILAETPTLFAYGIADPDDFPALRDVQLAAYMDPGLPPESYFHVEIRLETLLEETLAVPVAAARILNAAPLTFHGAVLSAGRVIYSRDERGRIAFEEGVWTKYLDLRHMLACGPQPAEEDAVTIPREEVTERLEQLEGHISHARGLVDAPSTEPITQAAGRYYLQSAITCCLAICLNLSVTLKLRPPRDLADIPEVLAEVSLLDVDVVRELTRLITIRDQLVYDPGKAETVQSHELPDYLASLERFARAIRERLEM